jgi:3-phenylpropionate/trans-cinnamate dioxygenase ferredoxin component
VRPPARRPRSLRIPAGLRAPGTSGSPYQPVATVDEVPPGGMVRVTHGDLDVLLVHTANGLAAVDDRCPHMAAPLSLGTLDGCVVACPLHSGTFDLRTGDPVRFPTTGGLDADGGHHPVWTADGSEARPPATDLKSRVRAATRIRRFRYYPLRVRAGRIEIALPTE